MKQFYYLSELKMLKPWLRLQSHVSEIQPVDFLKVMNVPEDSSFFSSDSFRSVTVSRVPILIFVNLHYVSTMAWSSTPPAPECISLCAIYLVIQMKCLLGGVVEYR